MFGSSYGTELGIGVPDVAQYSGQRAPELHGFRGCVSHSGFVHGWPAPVPRVVTEEARFSFTFLLHGCRRHHEFFEVSDEFVGQHHPEAVLDEVGHFLS